MKYDHCQRDLPAKAKGTRWCPFCGKDMIFDLSAPPPVPKPPRKRIEVNWGIFVATFLLPTFLQLASPILHLGLTNSFFGVGIASAIAGPVCGTLLGIYIGRTTASRIALAILLSLFLIQVNLYFAVTVSRQFFHLFRVFGIKPGI